MNKKTKGESFENSTHQTLQKLNPGAQVYKNVYIKWSLSKVKRQIDIKVTDPWEYEFIAFECKNHTRPLDIAVVEAFNTKLQDIGTKKWAIVSNSWYTEASKNMAEALNIDLLNLVNTKDKDIKTKVYLKLLISDTMVKSMRIWISGLGRIQTSLEDNTSNIILVNRDWDKEFAKNIFIKLWNNNELVSIEGEHKYNLSDKLFNKIVWSNWEMIDLKRLDFIYEVITKHFLKEIELIDTEGLYDVKNKRFISNSITTEEIEPYKIESSQPELSKIEAEDIIKGEKYSINLVCKSVIPTE